MSAFEYDRLMEQHRLNVLAAERLNEAIKAQDAAIQRMIDSWREVCRIMDEDGM